MSTCCHIKCICLFTNVTFHSSCLTTSSTNSNFFLLPTATPRTWKIRVAVFHPSFQNHHLQPSLNLVNGELGKSACPVQRFHVQLPPLHFQSLLSLQLWSFGRQSPRLITLFINLFMVINELG